MNSPSELGGLDTTTPCHVATCDCTEVRRYLNGTFCPEHSPWNVAGRPEPGAKGDASWMQRARFHTPIAPKVAQLNDDAEVL